MVKCYNCKYLTHMVRFEGHTGIMNSYCRKKEQVVTDKFLDNIQCDEYSQETREDIMRKFIGVPPRYGKTLRIQQEYEKQKNEGKTCKLVTKEDMKKKKQGDIYWMYGYPKQGEEQEQ